MTPFLTGHWDGTFSNQSLMAPFYSEAKIFVGWEEKGAISAWRVKRCYHGSACKNVPFQLGA